MYRPALYTGSERRAGSYRFAFSRFSPIVPARAIHWLAQKYFLFLHAPVRPSPRLLAPGGKRGPARLLPLLYCHATRIGPLWVTRIVDTGSGGRTGTTRLSSQSRCVARASTVGLKRLGANRYDPALLSEPVCSAGRCSGAEATRGEPVRPGPAGGVAPARGRGGARTVSAVKAGQVLCYKTG